MPLKRGPTVLSTNTLREISNEELGLLNLNSSQLVEWKNSRLRLPNDSTGNGSTADTAKENAPNITSDTSEGTADETKIDTNVTTVSFQVSSRHLILASPYFRKALLGVWQEARLHQGNMYDHVVEVESWNTEALLFVMSVIHGRTRAVPRSLSVHQLGEVARVVDYFACHEAVELATVLWAQSVVNMKDRPQYSPELLLSLSTAWVFREKTWFQELIKTCILQSSRPIPTLDLPGLHRISGKDTLSCTCLFEPQSHC
jgi:hypothetical protein